MSQARLDTTTKPRLGRECDEPHHWLAAKLAEAHNHHPGNQPVEIVRSAQLGDVCLRYCRRPFLSAQCPDHGSLPGSPDGVQLDAGLLNFQRRDSLGYAGGAVPGPAHQEGTLASS